MAHCKVWKVIYYKDYRPTQAATPLLIIQWRMKIKAVFTYQQQNVTNKSRIRKLRLLLGSLCRLNFRVFKRTEAIYRVMDPIRFRGFRQTLLSNTSRHMWRWSIGQPYTTTGRGAQYGSEKVQDEKDYTINKKDSSMLPPEPKPHKSSSGNFHTPSIPECDRMCHQWLKSIKAAIRCPSS